MLLCPNGKFANSSSSKEYGGFEEPEFRLFWLPLPDALSDVLIGDSVKSGTDDDALLNWCNPRANAYTASNRIADDVFYFKVCEIKITEKENKKK